MISFKRIVAVTGLLAIAGHAYAANWELVCEVDGWQDLYETAQLCHEAAKSHYLETGNNAICRPIR